MLGNVPVEIAIAGMPCERPFIFDISIKDRLLNRRIGLELSHEFSSSLQTVLRRKDSKSKVREFLFSPVLISTDKELFLFDHRLWKDPFLALADSQVLVEFVRYFCFVCPERSSLLSSRVRAHLAIR